MTQRKVVVVPGHCQPHLAVWKGDGRWRWYVANHPSPRYSDRTNVDGHATHAEALAVGLAALEAASVERISP